MVSLVSWYLEITMERVIRDLSESNYPKDRLIGIFAVSQHCSLRLRFEYRLNGFYYSFV